MRLTPHTPAPAFTGELIGGGSLSLSDLRGQPVLLKFYRFADCPVCNLHVRSLVERYDDVAAAGLTTVAVFHSPLPRGGAQAGVRPPLPRDRRPDKRIFDAYGVEASLGGMFDGKVARDYARAMRAGFFSRPFGHHGGIKGHPADFLIDGEGIIQHAHYGESYADSLEVDEVVSLARELGFPPVGAAEG
jgi:peroxiredoxin